MRESIHIDTPNKYLIIKLVIPVLTSSSSLLCKIKTIFTMKAKFIPIIQKLLHSDSKCRYSIQRMKQERIFICLSVIVILTYSFPTQLRSIKRYSNRLNSLLHILHIHNNFSVFCLEMQFCLLAILIIRRLRTLHEQINKVFLAKNRYGCLYRLHKTVANLKQVHKHLHDSCQLIIDYFNVPILISLTCTTTNIFMNLYFAIFGGSQDAVVAKRAYQEGLGHFIVAIYYFSRICLICIAAGQMINEVRLSR